MSWSSSGHITKLKQSIFAFRYLWVLAVKPFVLNTVVSLKTAPNKIFEISRKKHEIICEPKQIKHDNYLLVNFLACTLILFTAVI